MSPTRFPAGVTNAARTSDTYMLPVLDPTLVTMYFNDFHDDLVSWT